MFDKQMIRRSFERVTSAFELHERGGTSTFALTIVVRAQADSLRAIRPDVAEPLAGLADSVEAAGKEAHPEIALRDLAKRFDTWRKDTLAVLEAESRPATATTAKERAVLTEEERRAAREKLLAEARAMSPGGAPASPGTAPGSPAPKAAVKPVDEDDLSMEEIQKLLDGAKK
jgi:hypothetical protein